MTEKGKLCLAERLQGWLSHPHARVTLPAFLTRCVKKEECASARVTLAPGYPPSL